MRNRSLHWAMCASCVLLVGASGLVACLTHDDAEPGPSERDAAADGYAPPVPGDGAKPADDAAAPGDATDDAPDSNDDFGVPTEACSFTVNAPDRQLVTGVAASAKGNIGFAGVAYNLADGGAFDLGDGTPIKPPVGSDFIGFAGRLDRSCKIVWGRQLQTQQYTTKVAFDSKEDLWIFGQNGLVMTKLGPTGNVLFEKQYPGTFAPLAVAIDGNDSVVVVGGYGGQPSAGGDPLPSAYSGVLVAKYDSAGNHLWSKGFPGLQRCQHDAISLSLTATGDPIVAGIYGGRDGCSISFGGPSLPPTSGSGVAAFVVRLSGVDGAHVWSAGRTAAYGAAVCWTSQRILTAGWITGPNTFGDGGVLAPPDGGRSGFVATVDATNGQATSGAIVDAGIGLVTASDLACGGQLTSRALVAGYTFATPQRPYVQTVEDDGGPGWTHVFSGAPNAFFTSLSSGATRDIVLGGFSSNAGIEDVYAVRYTR